MKVPYHNMPSVESRIEKSTFAENILALYFCTSSFCRIGLLPQLFRLVFGLLSFCLLVFKVLFFLIKLCFCLLDLFSRDSRISFRNR